MKPIIYVLFLSVGITFAQENSNYTITINGEKYDYSLGQNFEYNAKKKGKLNINISQKDILSYNDGIIKFNHTKNFPISEAPEEDGIKQMTLISSDGSGVIIQQYRDFDPALMLDLMLNEVTKESKEYGYTEKVADVEITLKDGKKLKGKKSTLEYQGAVDEWIVYTYSRKDSGIIFLSMDIDKNTESDNSNKNIKTFFESLEILN